MDFRDVGYLKKHQMIEYVENLECKVFVDMKKLWCSSKNNFTSARETKVLDVNVTWNFTFTIFWLKTLTWNNMMNKVSIKMWLNEAISKQIIFTSLQLAKLVKQSTLHVQKCIFKHETKIQHFKDQI